MKNDSADKILYSVYLLGEPPTMLLLNPGFEFFARNSNTALPDNAMSL